MSERRRFYAEIEAELRGDDDAIVNDLHDWIVARRSTGQVGEAPPSVRFSPKPLRELKPKRNHSDTHRIFSRRATQSRDAEDGD